MARDSPCRSAVTQRGVPGLPTPTRRSPRPTLRKPAPHSNRSLEPGLRSPTRPNRGKHAPSHAPRVIPGSSPGIRSSPPDPSQTRKNAPRATSRVFWKKLLLRARRPLNTPPTPPASPHPLQAPPPVTCPMPRGPASPSPSRLWADPPCRWPLPRRGRSRRPKLGISLKKIRPNRLSPARPLWGRAGERRFPPFTPTPLRPTPTPQGHVRSYPGRPSPPKVRS